MTTAMQECDFVRTFHEPQIPTSPQVYGPENTRRSHVTLALDVLCLGHHNEAPGQFGTPYRRHTVFLRFCAGRRPVDNLAGGGGGVGVLAPTGQIAHNKVLPGNYYTMVTSRTSTDPVRPGTPVHTDIPK